MKDGKVILGVLAGLATGAFLGILFAPDKGSKTRKKIVKKANKYAHEVGDQLNSVVDDVTDRFKTARHEAEEAVERVKAKARKVKEDIETSANNRQQA